MEAIILAVILILTLFVTGGLLLLTIYLLGRANIMFIPAKQERAILIDTGESFNGRVIFESKVRALGPNHTFVDIVPGTITGAPTAIGRLIFKLTGMRYYGIPPFQHPHYSDLEFTHWVTNSGQTQRTILNEKLHTPYLLTSVQEFALEVIEAEDKDGNPVNVRGSFFAKATNYYTPTYVIKDYMAQMTARIANEVVDYVKTRSFVSNVGGTSTIIADIVDPKALAVMVVKMNTEILDSIGFTVVKLTIDNVQLAGVDSAAIVSAQGGVIIAQLEASAVVTRATAAKEARKLEGEGEQAYIKAQAEGLTGNDKVSPEVLARIAEIRALKDTQVTVFGGSPGVIVNTTKGGK